MRITMVSLPAFPVVEPQAKGIWGGTETRAITFARALAEDPQINVDFVVRHPSLKQPRMIDGVNFHPWPDPVTERNARIAQALKWRQAFPYISFARWDPRLLFDVPMACWTRFLNPASRTPWKAVPALEFSDPDLFAVFGVHSVAASVIHHARQQQCPSVLFLGSNADVDSAYLNQPAFRNLYGERSDVCAQVLQRADYIVAQNQFQQDELKSIYNRDSILIPNPIDFDNWQQQLQHATKFDVPWSRYVLWMGRADRFHKRADLALEIVRQTPEIKYVWVLNPQDRAVEEEVHAASLDNLHLIRQVPLADVPSLMKQAVCLLSTSSNKHEGVPNLFLQASATGLPIVSCEVDPGYLQQAGAGIVGAGDFSVVIDGLRSYWENNEQAALAGKAGEQFVQKVHDTPIVVEALKQAFARISKFELQSSDT